MKRLPVIAAAVLAAAAAAVASYALVQTGGTKTVVREVTVASSQPTSATSPLSVTSVYDTARKGVVEVTATSTAFNPFGGSQSQQAQGSGFVYDTAGHVITNDHVVAGASSVSVAFWDGSSYSAKVVATDPSTDLAVLKVSAPASVLRPLQLGDSGALQVGQGVVAIGSPFGLAETVTAGIVSALHRSMTAPNNYTIADSIQTDAAINHGNSGGPLLDLSGHVIGITAQIESDSGGNDGVGFAIPSNTVRTVVSQLLSSGTVRHAYIGVQISSILTGNGVRITEVRSGTPAEHAGLKVGDVITAIDGVRVESAGDLGSAVDAKQPGDQVTLTVLRSSQTKTVTVTLGERPS